jgi:hypothetical protein
MLAKQQKKTQIQQQQRQQQTKYSKVYWGASSARHPFLLKIKLAKKGDAMRAVVQKSIQSLHSFGRHFYGGGFAALPPFTFKYPIFGIVLAVFVNFPTAQEQDTNRQAIEEKRLDLLFDRIMQSMPDSTKKQIDSAASIANDHLNLNQKVFKAEKQLTTENTTTKTMVHELPDELKAKVERTIAEIQQRKEERKAQFRESHTTQK